MTECDKCGWVIRNDEVRVEHDGAEYHQECLDDILSDEPADEAPRHELANSRGVE